MMPPCAFGTSVSFVSPAGTGGATTVGPAAATERQARVGRHGSPALLVEPCVPHRAPRPPRATRRTLAQVRDVRDGHTLEKLGRVRAAPLDLAHVADVK